MRIALLGAGRIGRLHARLLTATPGVDSLVIGDADAARAQAVAVEVGATGAPSTDAALVAVVVGRAEVLEAADARRLDNVAETRIQPSAV